MSVTVRKACLSDVPWMLTELQSFDRFFGAHYSLFPDPEYAETTIRALVDEHVFFVAEKYEAGTYALVGFIGGVLLPHFLNPAIAHLSELFWWVSPAARGSSAGARLLKAFEDHGRQHAQWITMTLETDSPVDPASLTKRGYRAKETNYLLEVA